MLLCCGVSVEKEEEGGKIQQNSFLIHFTSQRRKVFEKADLFFCYVDNHLLVQDLYSMSPEGIFFFIIFFFSFLQNYTHNAFGFWETQRLFDMHGTTLHLFVILFPVQYMEKRFALETREIMTTQVHGFLNLLHSHIFLILWERTRDT